MRRIDADALMPLFMKKANTMKDRHGVKLGEEWLLNYNDIKDVIDNAPTVERPQGEWISTSERLPECMDNVLVTIQVGNRNPVVRSGYYAYGLFNIDNGDVWNWNDTEVKAWTPQPVPYEETEE